MTELTTDAIIQPVPGRDCVTGEPIPVVHADDCRALEAQLRDSIQQLQKRVVLYAACMNTGGADELHKRAAEAESALAAERKEAERYRYLRDELIEWKPPGYDGCTFGRFDLMWPKAERDLDACLDAAIAASRRAND